MPQTDVPKTQGQDGGKVSVCVSMCLSVCHCLSVCLPACLPASLPACLSVCQSGSVCEVTICLHFVDVAFIRLVHVLLELMTSCIWLNSPVSDD